jgi:putative tryptophan/tyrosine transport system substrate-binding protein
LRPLRGFAYSLYHSGSITVIGGAGIASSALGVVEMRRRHLFVLLAGCAIARPRRGQAQQSPVPLVGFLCSGAPDGGYRSFVTAFREGLAEGGYVEGRNLAIEFRWAESRYDRLPALAADLVSRGVLVLVAAGGTVTGLAAKAATTTTPIVFTVGTDPVADGLVTSFNRPGGNITGVAIVSALLVSKQLELLRSLIPGAIVLGVLVNPALTENAQQILRSIEEVKERSEQRIQVLKATTAAEIDIAFDALARLGVRALLVTADPLFGAQRDQIVALAARHRVPTLYFDAVFVTAGGLISYGSSITGMYRQAGVYVTRILKGEKPGDLPIVQPTKFELAINLKTAAGLGLAIPPTLLALADEVIE